MVATAELSTSAQLSMRLSSLIWMARHHQWASPLAASDQIEQVMNAAEIAQLIKADSTGADLEQGIAQHRAR
jgi:hypothetical protein